MEDAFKCWNLQARMAKTFWCDKLLFLSLFQYFWQIVRDLTPRVADV